MEKQPLGNRLSDSNIEIPSGGKATGVTSKRDRDPLGRALGHLKTQRQTYYNPGMTPKKLDSVDIITARDNV